VRTQCRLQARHGIQEPILRGKAYRCRVVEGRHGLDRDGRMLVQRGAGVHQMLRPISDIGT